MTFDTVHNYYERLVINELRDHYRDKGLDEDQLADLACLALNQIPPRYIRYDIDMSFFMTPIEHDQVEQRVRDAVSSAYVKLTQPKDKA